jgi:hypothetical protein
MYFIAFFGLIFFKVYWLIFLTGSSDYSFVINDLLWFGLVLCIPYVLGIPITILYLLDFVSLVFFASSFSLEQFVRFIYEYEIWKSLFLWHQWFLVSATIIFIIFPGIKLVSKYKLNSKLIMVFVFGIFLNRYLSNNIRYDFFPLDIFSYKSNIVYDQSFAKQSSDEIKNSLNNIQIPNVKNIVLVISESLTISDSYKLSGLYNYIPLIDSISDKGRAFTNFFANGPDSEMGQIGILTGIAPVHAPLSLARAYHDFEGLPSVLQTYKKNGYKTSFIIGCYLNWLYMDRFILSLGFDLMLGRGEIELFKNTKPHVFEAVSDEILFSESLKIINSWKIDNQKNLIVIVTSSNHKPWSNPRTNQTGEIVTLNYIDQTTYEFYNQLEKNNFFTDGILILTGDHRKLTVPTNAELQKYGKSAYARIPLIIWGDNIKPGIDNTYFQQADVLKELGNFSRNINVESKDIYFTPISIAGYSKYKSQKLGNLWLFNQDYPFVPLIFNTYGNEVDILNYNSKVSSLDSKVQQVHKIRSGIQSLYKDRSIKCGIEKPNFLVSNQNGVTLQMPQNNYKSQIKNISIPKEFIKNKNFSLNFTGGINFPVKGEYWFEVEVDDGACFAINGEEFISSPSIKEKSIIHGSYYVNNEGILPFEFRYSQWQDDTFLDVKWRMPGKSDFSYIPAENLFTVNN